MLQLIPHEVPSQVAVPFEGTGHAVHDVPQEFGDALLEHVLPQLCVPLGQAHTPFWHVAPPVHAWLDPQPPQLLASVW